MKESLCCVLYQIMANQIMDTILNKNGPKSCGDQTDLSRIPIKLIYIQMYEWCKNSPPPRGVFLLHQLFDTPSYTAESSPTPILLTKNVTLRNPTTNHDSISPCGFGLGFLTPVWLVPHIEPNWIKAILTTKQETKRVYWLNDFCWNLHSL